ncbi:MAG: threonylcarbamoyl-AMP synthase [Ruminococcaceae bacterium]|nr:threonylcarbamoyl-AMP synthase [Oscillospiraceae bacterium]
MQTLLIKEANKENIDIAADIIKNGGLVVMPTETVYGLGANALDKNAVTNVYKAKGRPMDNPLIVHLSTANDAEKYAYTNELFYKLADRFMPGPLTVILPKKDIVPYEVSCGLDTVAIRVPSNEIAHRLIETSGCPIAAPSANLSGKPSPTSFAHVVEDMNGRVDAIIDGGECDIGLESTVIIIKDESAEILRPGKITYEELKEIIPDIKINSAVKNQCTDEKVASPGMKYRHYAPSAPVFLVEGNDNDIINFFKTKQQTENCGILCFSEDEELLLSKNVLTFGRSDDETSQAHELFDKLRRFDNMNVERIYARIPSDKGVGLAVYNRLIRAAGFDIIKANNIQE